MTITGVDDALFDADQRYRILLGPATSADADYDGKTVKPVEVRNRDDETLRFFRTFNPQANFHFFTTSVSEFQGVQPNGYNDESSGRGGFSLAATQTVGFTQLFRLYNLEKGFHYYTASAAERDALLALNPPQGDPNFGKVGWRFEGSPGFIADTSSLARRRFPALQPHVGNTPVHREPSRQSDRPATPGLGRARPAGVCVPGRRRRPPHAVAATRAACPRVAACLDECDCGSGRGQSGERRLAGGCAARLPVVLAAESLSLPNGFGIVLDERVRRRTGGGCPGRLFGVVDRRLGQCGRLKGVAKSQDISRSLVVGACRWHCGRCPDQRFVRC